MHLTVSHQVSLVTAVRHWYFYYVHLFKFFIVKLFVFPLAPPADPTNASKAQARKRKKGIHREAGSRKLVAAVQKIKHVLISG